MQQSYQSWSLYIFTLPLFGYVANGKYFVSASESPSFVSVLQFYSCATLLCHCKGERVAHTDSLSLRHLPKTLLAKKKNRCVIFKL